MNIHIELLVILALIFVSLISVFLVWYGRRRALKKYNPDNDIGKKGEEHRKELIARGLADPVTELAATEPSSSGLTPVEERRVLPTTTIKSDGKDSNKFRGSSKLARFFNSRR